MNVSSDVLAAHLGDDAVLLDLAAKRYYRLNETAAVVFRAIESGEGRAGAISALVAGFEVSEPDAAAAVDALLGDLAARGIVAPNG
ncbi:MAG TPA: PqqD family protein [Gemmatimonadaceae bacterium]|jgi:hypothetical protein|nr:PqqD family protein [Gemmatimonadaceae bacterium]